ncbi:FAD-binding protein [Acetonema longum]|uniref:Succinate dehydrogenase flavoprotein subunit n=1 Tax=Acetonema longum DSM 6540 TaxID=1009370 RepID=F7NF35_9FIRM|nr:FAD-binding protein [Acetonema longum]EGO65290.1 succinate dehydrogenase flavoprotein subunit [Acetonema longum DSM 6540]
MKITEQMQTDVLVIGAGGGGLRAALAAAEAGSQVLLVNKGPVARSGITLTAAGGMQAPFAAGDDPERYFTDTIENGYYLADQNLVKVLAEDACARALDAERFGARLVRDTAGDLQCKQFPGQSKPRNLFFKGGGVGLAAALARACRNHDRITVVDDFYVSGLLKSQDLPGAAAGALGLDLRRGGLTQINAKAVVVATGGFQWLWAVNDCPADATGDGLVQAYRLGAELVDMEMVLFYPTVIVWPESVKGAFVHYEFLSPEMLDGNVYDKNGQPILPKPLPVRDTAMRLMAGAIADGRGTDRGGVLWSVADSPKGTDAIRKMLNLAQYNYIRAHGLEPATDQVETAPGAHYLMGGIHIDETCRTSVPGLFAAAECAGNFDGANRLAGNGITATQVFGARAGLTAHAWAAANGPMAVDTAVQEQETARVAAKVSTRPCQETSLVPLRDKLRAATQTYAGVNRNADGLLRLVTAAREVQLAASEIQVADQAVFNQQLVDLLQLETLCEAAGLVAGSALLRQESRGHHYRTDFPQQNDVFWRQHTLAYKLETGPRFTVKPVVKL